MSYYINVITRNYANFNGRARRKEYWMFAMYNAIIGMIFAFIVAFTKITFLPFVYYLIVFLPSVAVSIRRLHDIDKSGVWIFISLVPIIGTIWYLILTLTEGTRGYNEYGEDPKLY